MTSGPSAGVAPARQGGAVDGRPPRLRLPGRPGRPGTAAGSSAIADPAPPDGIPSPPRLRRRPLHVVAGLLAVTVGAILAAWLFTSVGNTRPVLAVRTAVDRGEVITAADLMTVNLTPDPALKAVPADQLSAVVGQRATADLPAGGLVVQGSFARTPVPVSGQSLVGIWLTQGQMPGESLRSGDRVRVVATPRQQETAPKEAPTSVAATVVSTLTSSDGHTLVTVSVPSSVAPMLTAMVATARIGMVLDSAAR